ncbi:hypothetical protein O3G_MSEX015420 [Manduca sexta]|uniref:phosphoethanolamine N-methyltransferase n=1 Tax=Manduca sexta TaxID=7130 RepID=A0A922A260_MANSE|nr:hypothetical protein O3G_MSEX015420 [Manduca sexta]
MSDSKSFQEFLDNGQYSKNGVERYEWIFGETFLSSGGMAITPKVLRHADLGSNPKVLDIGSGLGGHSFLIADNFDAEVIGIDLSVNMMDIANKHLENRPHLKDRVSFRIEDYTKSDFPAGTFDMVYSRDSFIHITDKVSLFKNIYKWLKPGGYFLFTDYVRGEDETKYSTEFREYLKKRGYNMSTITEYKKILKSAGFRDFEVKDWGVEWKNILQVEVNRLRSSKQVFLRRFSRQDFDDLESGWLNKIRRVDDGVQGWVLTFARK